MNKKASSSLLFKIFTSILLSRYLLDKLPNIDLTDIEALDRLLGQHPYLYIVLNLINKRNNNYGPA